MHDFYKPGDGNEDSDDDIANIYEASLDGDEDDDVANVGIFEDSSSGSEEVEIQLSDNSELEVFEPVGDPELEDHIVAARRPVTRSTSNQVPGTSRQVEDNEDEEDDTIRALVAALKNPRTNPAEIRLDDFVTDISFHPEKDIIALASITGDVLLYKYSNEENSLLKTLEVHNKACRDVEWSEDGKDIYTASKDKSIAITDVETEKLKNFYDDAHDTAIYKLYIVDENLFATGDDSGTVKLWDIRTKDAVFSLKEVEDYISDMLTNCAKKILLVTSGDGYLTSINIGARKMYVQSEPYEEELTCMGLYRNDSKLIVGTSKGRLYSFNWGEFGYHCDMFPGIKNSIGCMLPLTDRIACVSGEEGIIRAAHIAPYRTLGIIGQHNLPVEAMDINHSGEIIASSSHNNDVRFWNIKYFEDFPDIKYNDKHNAYKERRHNLPSSRYTNPSDFFSDLANSSE